MVELNDPYGGGYFATRDRWKAREAADADTAYKLALISKSQRDAMEAERLRPYEDLKRQYDLAKLAGEVREKEFTTAKQQNEYVRQRIGPIVMAHARGELPDMAARAAIEQEVLRARDQFGIGDDEVQMLLQAGPQDWGRYLEQSLPVKEQRAAPPSPELFYQGDTATQKQWNPRTGAYEVVGQRKTFAPNAGVRIELNTKDKLAEANRLRDDLRTEIAPLNELAKNINLIRTYAAQPDPLNSQQLQAILANLASTSVRAQAELNKYGNFGDLPTRFFGAVSKLATGEYTPEQLQQALKLAADLEREVLNPARESIAKYYSGVAQWGGVPSDLVIRDMQSAQPTGGGTGITQDDEALINKYLEK